MGHRNLKRKNWSRYGLRKKSDETIRVLAEVERNLKIVTDKEPDVVSKQKTAKQPEVN